MMGIYSLYLDHSSREGVSALLKDGCVVDMHCCDRDRARHPCQAWQELLDRHDLRVSDLSFFACGVGPGSYTGIRSAAATVQAAAFATGKPIVALSSLLLYVPTGSGSYMAVADAGPGGAFVQSMTVCGGTYHIERSERMELPAALARARPDLTLVCASSEWIWEKMAKSGCPSCEQLLVREVSPHVATVAAVAYQEWQAGRLYSARSLPLDYIYR
jgi:tRNA threonylcarbamoyladenosine biosynthesis protein TsaB